MLERSNDISAPDLLNSEIFWQNVTASGGGSVIWTLMWEVAFVLPRHEPLLILSLISTHRSKAHQLATSLIFTW